MNPLTPPLRTEFFRNLLGSFGDDWRAQLALIDPLMRHPNVYTDTSGVRRFDLLLQAVRRAGAKKLLFGSDGPWLHPGIELAKVRALKLPAADEALILSGNLLRLMGNTSRIPDNRRFRHAERRCRGIIRDPWEAVGSSAAPRL